MKMLRHNLIIASSITLLSSFASAFVLRSSYVQSSTKVRRATSPTSLSLFEDDDVSAFNALCQFGPSPFFIRVTQSEKYWNAVENFELAEGCSRVIAVRNMDAFFSDPDGWGLARDREKKYGEVRDYTKKTGVQKRPVFSLFWACLVFWFFFSFIPTRVSELGVHPSALEGGLCPPDVRITDKNGKGSFECRKVRSEQSFPFNAISEPGKLY